MYACERAASELDRMPQERRSDWLPKARADFQIARANYEQELDHLIAARQRLAQETELLSFLGGGQIRMPSRLRVSVSDVEGLSSEVVVDDALMALRDELAELEFDALRGARA
jgi:hypothetical protein